MKKNLFLIALTLLAACSGTPIDRVNTISGNYANPAVEPPKGCPDFSHYSADDWNNHVGSNYGCSTVTNFGVMVADPNDLVAGKSSDRYNGARTAVSVGQYEAGPPANNTPPTQASSTSQ